MTTKQLLPFVDRPLVTLPAPPLKLNDTLNQLRLDIFGQPMVYNGVDCYEFYCHFMPIWANQLFTLWEPNRAIDLDRAKNLAKVFAEEYTSTGTITSRLPIIVCKKAQDDKYYIVDGQHRYYSLCLMNTMYGIDLSAMKIRFNVIIVNTDSDIMREFVNINKGEPVKECYLNPSDILDLCISRLKKEYKYAFTEGKRRPKINTDSFKTELIKAKLTTNMTAEGLRDLIIKTNRYYLEQPLESLQYTIAKNDKKERERIATWSSDLCLGKTLIYGFFKPNKSGIWLDKMKEIKNKIN